MTKANLIFNINPLVIAITGYLILNEKITKINVLALIGAFAGMILFNIHKNETKNVSDLYYFGIGMVTWTCFCFTAVTILTRILNRKNHYALSTLYFGITTTLESLTLLLIQLTFGIGFFHFPDYTLYDFTLFFLSGVINYLGHITRSIALKYEEATYIAPFSYLQVVCFLICDLAFFGYISVPLDYIGATITTFWVMMPVFRNIYASNKK